MSFQAPSKRVQLIDAVAIGLASGNGALRDIVSQFRGFFRFVMSRLRHEVIHALVQVADLRLVVAHGLISHFALASGGFIRKQLLTTMLEHGLALRDVFPLRLELRKHGALFLGRRLVCGTHRIDLVSDRLVRAVGIGRNLISGLINDVVNVLLQLLDHGLGGVNLGLDRCAFRRRDAGVALQIQITRLTTRYGWGRSDRHRRNGPHLVRDGKRNSDRSARLIRHGVLDGMCADITGIAAEGLVGQLAGLIELAALEGLFSQTH